MQDVTGIRFIDCQFHNNQASSTGGAVHHDGGSACFVNCRFTGNNASVGGAINAQRVFGFNFHVLNLANCVFSGNVASGNGGGLATNSSTNTFVDHCTFSSNDCSNVVTPAGGGIHVNDILGGQLLVANSILWGNTNAGGSVLNAQIDGTGGLTQIDYTCMQGFAGGFGTGNIGSDPDLDDPDGFDDVLGTLDDNVRISFDSNCIDAGSNAETPADKLDIDGDGDTGEPLPEDPDGRARTSDGDGNGSSVTDMGAYEFHGCHTDLGFAGYGPLFLEFCGEDLSVAGNTATLRLKGGPPSAPLLLMLSLQHDINQLPPAFNFGLGRIIPKLGVPSTALLVFGTDAQGEINLGYTATTNPPLAVYAQFLDTNTTPYEISNALEVFMRP